LGVGCGWSGRGWCGLCGDAFWVCVVVVVVVEEVWFGFGLDLV
jgi:hypothetical protein